MTYETLTISLADKIAHVRLNRPDKANAMNRSMWQDIRAAMGALSKDPACRVVVLAGAGKQFCAGIDFGYVMDIFASVQNLPEGRKQEALHEIILDLQECLSSIESCRKPVIAQIHGPCIGGGVDLIAGCDIRVASSKACFSIKEVDLGLVADVGTLQRLPRLVSQGVLRDWAFTGRMVSAAEAESKGLVDRLVTGDDAQLSQEVNQLAATIAAKSPLVIRGLKRVLNRSADLTIGQGLDYVAAWNASMLLSQDAQKASMAVMGGSKAAFDD